MAKTAQLPELLLKDLRALYATKQAADRDYRMVLNAGLMGLGMDPREPVDVNLDTGAVTPTAPNEPSKDNPA